MFIQLDQLFHEPGKCPGVNDNPPKNRWADNKKILEQSSDCRRHPYSGERSNIDILVHLCTAARLLLMGGCPRKEVKNTGDVAARVFRRKLILLKYHH